MPSDRCDHCTADGPTECQPPGGPDRRTVLRSAGVAAAAAAGAGLLAGCGTSSGGSSGGGSPSAGGTGPLAEAADIPVGGGKIFADRHVVVTQPKAGTFHGFSSTCTHQGCTVSKVSDGRISCPCHGSQFSVSTGAVLAGPAPRPLPKVALRKQGGQIFLA